MRKAEYTEIIIDWKPPVRLYKLEDIQTIKDSTENVLYQIYGDSHIYGQNTLLNIGISLNASTRFYQHLTGVFGYANNTSIRIGHLATNVDSLEIPESILIANHKPSFNKEFIHDLSPLAKRNKIIVINNGDYGMLKSCCTNFWWVDNKN